MPKPVLTPELERRVAKIAARLLPGENVRSIRPAPTGVRTLALLVEMTGDGRGLVVKLHGRLSQARASAAALRHMAKWDLPVPRLLMTDYLARLRRGIGGYITVEERVPGVPVALTAGPDRERACRLAGRALGRLHSVRRRGRGGLGWGRPGGDVERELSKELERLQRRGSGLAPELRERLRDELASRARSAAPPEYHSLLHGHVNGGNILVAETDDRAWLVDVGSARYGHFGRDLLRALERLPGPDENCRAALEEAYFASVEGVTRDDWRSASGFYRLAYLLQQYCHAGRKGRDAAAELAALEAELESGGAS